MAVDQKSYFCKLCGKKTLHARHRVSEMWGCLLTILTLGLWIPIWLVMSLFGGLGAYRCQTCGRKKGLFG
jgi:ribosomal protein L37AE/L43A